MQNARPAARGTKASNKGRFLAHHLSPPSPALVARRRVGQPTIPDGMGSDGECVRAKLIFCILILDVSACTSITIYDEVCVE